MLKSTLYFSTPFIACLATFLLLSHLGKKETFSAPSIIGCSIADGIITLSQHNLHPHILEQREDATCTPGTIIEQNPRPGQQIKEKQPIFLVVSKAIIPPKSPNLVGLSLEQAKKIAFSEHTLIKTFAIEHIHPKGTIIAQFPHAGEPIPTEGLILYVSTGQQESHLVTPDLQMLHPDEAKNILEAKNIPYQIIRAKNKTIEKIKKQRPIAGTIITQTSPPTFQLEVG